MSSRQVLIIDDHKEFASAVGAAITAWGHVQVTHSAAEARRQAAAQSWDLVILDYELPDGVGYELVHEFKSRNPKTRVIVISGQLDKNRLIDGFNYPLDGVLEKPFDLDALEKRLHALGWYDTGFRLRDDSRSLERGAQVWPLTAIEARLLKILMEASAPISKTDIENRIWPNQSVSKNTFDTHLYNLKRKVPDLTSHIQVIRGQGYVWKS